MIFPPRWDPGTLHLIADHWLHKKTAEKRAWKDLSPWWSFLHDWPKEIHQWLANFVAGQYRFSPLKQYAFADETVMLWNCEDRLILHWLHTIIQPVFKHLLSPYCFSQHGINGVKRALDATQAAFKARRFRYVIRLDVKSYYASIDHKILLQQLNASFDDPRLQHYFQAIVTVPIDKDAVLYSPHKGIPRRSSLSPFFGNLYLTPLDRAFAHKPGIFYGRYMDDILILTETKSQFVRAKKRVKKELADLKLKLSPHKTKMGKFNHFHFLGVNFTASTSEATHKTATKPEQPATPQNMHRTPNASTQSKQTRREKRSDVSAAATRIAANKTQVTMRLHPRSCRRALDKVSVMKEGRVHPQYIQRYLISWAIWWKRATKSSCPVQTNLMHYVTQAYKLTQDDLAWLGRGLIESRYRPMPSTPC